MQVLLGAPVGSKVTLEPWVLAIAVWVPQAKEGVACQECDIRGDALTILGATTHTPLRNHQLQAA